jgi:hypothetical protein
MPKLPTAIQPEGEAFVANRQHMEALVEDLHSQLATAALGGGPRTRERHAERGKLLPRERIEASCWTAAAPSSSSRPGRLTACTTMPPPPPA